MERSTMRGGWAGVVTSTLDGKPIIDCHPDVEGLFFFTGDNGSSFKTSPAIGRIFADWIVDGLAEEVSPNPFRLSRFAEGAHLIGPHEYGDRDYDAVRARGVMLG
jgi:sarcosine oxidase subunit beta